MEPFIGEIIMFGGNFAPRGWAFCNGALIAISQNQALFAILGTTYGGDGRTSFGLPDLRGRAPIHAGTGPGLSTRPLGQRGGEETNILNVTQLPSHNHEAVGKIKASSIAGNTNNPGSNYLATGKVPVDRSSIVDANIYLNTPTEYMANDGVEVTVGNTGGSRPINNMQPYLTVNYIIALVGIFPSRN